MRRAELLLLVCAVCACGRTSGGSSGGAASDAFVAAGDAAAAPRPAASERPPPAPRVPPPCKAATVKGSVLVMPLVGQAPDGAAGVPVVEASAVPDDVWIDVAKSSRLTTRDGTSTRETSFEGPGRFRACIGHKEEAWIGAGVFESVGGAGERPGGEEWVATPLGELRYDAAKCKITVGEKELDASVAAGTAYLWPVDGAATQFSAEAGASPVAGADGWVRLDNGTRAHVSVPKPVLTEEGARASLERCEDLAAQARRLARSFDAPDADLGELGPRHVTARRLARAACAVASLRVESLPPSAGRPGLVQRALAADEAWREVGK